MNFILQKTQVRPCVKLLSSNDSAEVEHEGVFIVSGNG